MPTITDLTGPAGRLEAVLDRYKAAGEGTFASLVREIAVSQTLAVRNPGGAQ